MAGATDANGVQSGRDQVGDNLFFQKEQSQRSRPEKIGQGACFFRDGLNKLFCALEGRHMNDQGVKVRTVLGNKYFCDSSGIQSITGQTIYSFGRNSHQFTCLQEPDCFVNVLSDFGHCLILDSLLPTAYRLRLTAYGLRLTAYGLRLTAYRLPL